MTKKWCIQLMMNFDLWWIKRSNTLSLYEKRQSNYKEAACFMPQPPLPCPLSRIMELMFESNPSQRCYPKNWNKKWSLQALDTCKRFSWKACIAVCRCRMFDSWCTSTYKVCQVPIALLCMVDCYTAYFRLIEIIQKIVRKVMINWKTFVWQMQISCIS